MKELMNEFNVLTVVYTLGFAICMIVLVAVIVFY